MAASSISSARRAISDTVQINDWARDIPGAKTADGRVWLFPIVRGQSRSGKETKWLISVRMYDSIDAASASGAMPREITDAIAHNKSSSGGDYVAQIQIHYQMGNGIVQIRTPTYVTAGKRFGTIAETNIFCQALRDALSLYNKQLRRVGVDDGYPLPMLAQFYSDVYAENVDPPMPLFVQRKYNGVRAIGTINESDDGILYSRTGLLYSGFNALRAAIAQIVRAYGRDAQLYLDGELYKHGAPLQEISGIVRRVQNSGLDTQQSDLTFVVYDIFIKSTRDDDSNSLSELTFAQRLEIMYELFRNNRSTIITLAETFQCDTMNCVREHYAHFLREGYEGAIIRLNRKYDHSINGRHSPYLLKMKPIRDAEFEIIGWTVGTKGRARGAVMFICVARADNGSSSAYEFNVNPTGTIESRVALAREFARMEDNGRTVFENAWKGRPLIVTFDELSVNGVPQRARTDGVIRELP